MGELEKLRYDLNSCLRCGVCRSKYDWGQKVFGVCPAGEHSEGFWANFPTGRVQTAWEIMENGRLKITEAPVDAIFQCLLCANCREKCGATNMKTLKSKIDQPEIVKALRADMFAAGVRIPEGIRLLGVGLEKTHNVLGAPAEERTDWLEDDIKVEKGADTIYFPGCLAAYRAPEVAQATARVLNKGGIKFDILGEEEWCCGNPLIMTGQLPLAREIVQHNFELLKGKSVITSCAGCYRTLKDEYAKLMGKEYKIKARPVVGIIAELIKAGKLKFKPHHGAKEIVTYHDPCELGRWLKVYEPPRNVINAIPGVELVEMVRNRGNAWCCGGGGGAKAYSFDFAVEIGTDRIKEALATGAKRIVSACPSCKINLNDAIRAMGKEAEIKAIDITELVIEHLA